MRCEFTSDITQGDCACCHSEWPKGWGVTPFRPLSGPQAYSSSLRVRVSESPKHMAATARDIDTVPADHGTHTPHLNVEVCPQAIGVRQCLKAERAAVPAAIASRAPAVMGEDVSSIAATHAVVGIAPLCSSMKTEQPPDETARRMPFCSLACSRSTWMPERRRCWMNCSTLTDASGRMPDVRICARLGCEKPCRRRAGNSGVHRWCCARCRKWHLAFTAFCEGGVALGRDAEIDDDLFARTLDPRVHREARPLIDELFDAYGRA